MEEYILNESNFKVKSKKPRKLIKYIIKNTCWECISYNRQDSGYILISRDGKKWLHRYIYELYNNKIPKNKEVMHTCDNRACINPEHLKLGTHKDNMLDMKNKNRGSKFWLNKMHKEETINKMSKIKIGENNPNNKYKIEVFLRVKELFLLGFDENKIKEELGVSISSIKRVKSGKHWSSELLGGRLKDWRN